MDLKLKITEKEYMDTLGRVRTMIKAIGKRDDVSVKANSFLFKVCWFLIDLQYTKIGDKKDD